MSFDSPKAAFPTHNNNAGSSDFFNFDTTPTADTFSQKPPAEGNGSATKHDWDALFAPLGGPKESGNGQDSKQSPTSRQPGWALTADTGEDDMILQRLTIMGYPRDESLAALEKFDYNIDKVSRVDFST
jgi:epidermal growth factor receptor substrate 15